jgi:hypothetical protein
MAWRAAALRLSLSALLRCSALLASTLLVVLQCVSVVVVAVCSQCNVMHAHDTALCGVRNVHCNALLLLLQRSVIALLLLSAHAHAVASPTSSSCAHE